MSQVNDWPRYSRWTWIVALLLILLLFALWLAGRGPDSTLGCCAGAPLQSGAATQDAGKIPLRAGALGFSVKDGSLVLTGSLPDAAGKAALLAAAAAAARGQPLSDQLGVNAALAASPCARHVAAIVALLQTHPGVSVACDGTGVTLSGEVADEATRQLLGNQARQFVAADGQLSNNLRVASAAAAVADPFALDYRRGKWTASGAVPDAAARDSVIGALQQAFGTDNVVDRLKIAGLPGAAASPCVLRFGEMLAWLRQAAGVGIRCDGTVITLSGEVPDEAVRAAYLKWARDFFGADFRIEDQLSVVAPVVPVTKAEDLQCGDRMGVMVTFATGSAQIDAAGHRLLDAIAACLKQGDYEVAGHTDNVASDAINNPLSQSRADAVRDYLVSKGVPAAHLTAQGYGSFMPIADNATDEGRARNRRIEFHKR